MSLGRKDELRISQSMLIDARTLLSRVPNLELSLKTIPRPELSRIEPRVKPSQSSIQAEPGPESIIVSS